MRENHRFQRFDFVIGRQDFRDKLQKWLDEEPRRVRKIVGHNHDLLVCWRPCKPHKRTTHVEVAKFISETEDPMQPLWKFDCYDTDIDALGRNGFFVFVFYRRRIPASRHRVPTTSLPAHLL